MVTSVIFTCTNPTLPDRDDVIGETSVSSSVVIDTSYATANATLCSCSAVWDPDPELYANVTEARLLLEYQATVDKFTVNGTSELSVLEDEQVTAVFRCDTTGRSSARVSIRKTGSTLVLGNTADVTTGNDTDSAERNLVHTYTVMSARCEDMGTYTCTADSGFVDVTSDSVRLTVSCGPRLYNGSTNPPPLLTTEGLQVYLVAHPPPVRITYTFTYNSTVSLTEADKVLKIDCQKHMDLRHLVVCSFKRDKLAEDYLGVYTVSIANPFGEIEFRVNVNDEDDALISKATERLIGGLLAAAILVVVVVVIIFLIRERNAKRYRSKHAKNDEEDVEAAGEARRDSTTASADSDPSVPFREVRPLSRSSGPERTRSAPTLAEVVPRNSDVIFAVAQPKLLESDTGYFDFGELPAYSIRRKEEDEDEEEDEEEKKVGACAAVSVGTSTAFAEDSTLYETGYMSVDLTPKPRLSPAVTGKARRSAQQAESESGFDTRKSGSEFALETKQHTFITKIFLPEQSSRKSRTTEQDHDYDDTVMSYRRDEYAQVKKKAKKPASNAAASQKDTGTSVEEDALENAFKLEDFDLDDTEEEKMVSIDLDDTEEEKMASIDLEDEDEDEEDTEGSDVDENDPRFEEMYEVTSKSKTSTAKRDRGTDSLRWLDDNERNEERSKKSSRRGDAASQADGERETWSTSDSARTDKSTPKKSDAHDSREGTIDKKKRAAAGDKGKEGKEGKSKQHSTSPSSQKTSHSQREKTASFPSKKTSHNQREKTTSFPSKETSKDQREKTPDSAKGSNPESGDWRPEPKKRKNKLKLIAKKKKTQDSYEVEKNHVPETDGSEAELIKTL